MPRNFVRILSQVALTVGGVLVSAGNGLPTIFANDATAGGTLSTGTPVEISCDGRAAVTLGISGTWGGTIQFEAYDGTTWWPMRAHIVSTAGLVSLSPTTTTNVSATIPCATFSKVRANPTTAITGTCTVAGRASASPRGVVALMAAQGIVAGAAPTAALLQGVKDGSGNLQALSLGQALLASCLPVALPVAQDVVAYAGAATGANVPASALLAGFRDPTGKLQAALLNASNVLRVQQDFGYPSVPWLVQASTTMPTAGVQIGAVGPRVFRSGWVENTTGANVIIFIADRTSTISNGQKSDRGYTNTITSNGIGSLVPTGLSVEGGTPCANGIWGQPSSTVGVMAAIASTAIYYVAIYS